MSKNFYRKTYIEINSKNLISNVKQVKDNFPDYKYYFAIIKGNAYGHGYGIVKILIENGVNYLAVSTLEEALEIREYLRIEEEYVKNIPILIMQPIHLEDLEIAGEHNISVTVTNVMYYIEMLKLNFKNKLKVHIKLNTGMNRLGLSDNLELKSIIDLNNSQIKSNIEIEGIYSHFATSGILDDYYKKQVNKIYEILQDIDLSKIKILHFDKSLTLLNQEKIAIANGFRLGISMYGYDLSPKINQINWSKIFKVKSNLGKLWRNLKIKKLKSNQVNLKPCLSLFSEIIEIRKCKKGEFGNYDKTFILKEDTIIGIVAVGYADGYMRKNKNSYVFVNDKKCQILGMINMGMIFIEIDESVKLYDKVELIGDNMMAKVVANKCETSIYEVITVLNKDIPRIII